MRLSLAVRDWLLGEAREIGDPNIILEGVSLMLINHRQRVPASAGRKSPSRQLQTEVRPAAAADSGFIGFCP